MSPFTYGERLHGRTIRLIRLEPDDDDSLLSCSLQVDSLDDEPEYDAISYCWGDQSPSAPLLCNGAQLLITPNLHDALRRFREPRHAVMLWADAICINQTDIQEKSEQVPLMGSVYGQARHVRVWLGQADEYTAEAVQIITAMARFAYAVHGEKPLQVETVSWEGLLGGPPSVQTISWYPGGAQIMNTTPADGSTWPRLDAQKYSRVASFLDRPWFRRVWVIQEVALSRGRSALYCGGVTLPWLVFELGILAAWVFDKPDYSVGVWRATALARITGWFRAADRDSAEDGLGMFWLLRTNQATLATDPRDKVFGLLGIARRDPSTDSGLFITPDYAVSAANVYQKVTEKFLDRFPTLVALSVPRWKKPGYQVLGGLFLPSWVTDWSSSGAGEFTTPNNIDDLHERGASLYGYDACCTGVYPKFCEVHGKVLTLSGYVLDSIEASSQLVDMGPKARLLRYQMQTQRSPDEDFVLLAGQGVLRALEVWHCSLKRMPPSSLLRVVDILSATTGMARPDLDPHVIHRALQSLRRAGKLLTALHKTPYLHRIPGGYGVVLYGIREYAARISGNEAGRLVASWVLDASQNKCAVRTQQGYVGKALTPYAAVGDRIVLVRGAHMPLILRPGSRGSWQLIGECYVHGIMHGEAFDINKCEDIRIE